MIPPDHWELQPEVREYLGPDHRECYDIANKVLLRNSQLRLQIRRKRGADLERDAGYAH